MTSVEPALEPFRERFLWAADHQYHKSPLYQRLCRAAADDSETLALAAHARPGQPLSNLFLGAVHWLLLGGVGHPLAAFFPSVAQHAARSDDPTPIFHDFCRAFRPAIQTILETRRVQTNEVQRCACLLPAFSRAARLAGGRPWALIEVGASAGLNLRWDHYGYHFSDGRRAGDADSAVQLSLTLRGKHRPPLMNCMPPVVSRMGIDLDPVDVSDAEAAAWLRALIWPEQADRADRLQRALDEARRDPPTVLRGDVLEHLPDLLASAPPESFVCLFHSFVTNQMRSEDHEQLTEMVAAAGANRDLADVALEWRRGDTQPSLRLRTFRDGQANEGFLAWCDDHGAWLEWQPA